MYIGEQQIERGAETYICAGNIIYEQQKCNSTSERNTKQLEDPLYRKTRQYTLMHGSMFSLVGGFVGSWESNVLSPPALQHLYPGYIASCTAS